MVKYLLTKKASLHLQEIFLYTTNRWNVTQAEKYLNELLDSIEKISENILIGKSCGKLTSQKHLQYYKAKKHYIIYRRKDDVCQVIAIFHERMNLEYHIKRL